MCGIPVRTDAEGRYSLNDLHRAAGGEQFPKGEERHQPSNWERLDQTQALVAEIFNSSEMRSKPLVSKAGRYGGTYVVKELVYAYAMWISPAFSLKVIRAYDALVTGNLPALDMPPALSDALMMRFGGVTKGIVNKRIEHFVGVELPMAMEEWYQARIPAMVEAEIAKSRVLTRYGESAGEIWHRHNLPPIRIGPWFTNRLKEMGCEVPGGSRAKAGMTSTRLFDPDLADKAMKAGLIQACRSMVAKKTGQLHFDIPYGDNFKKMRGRLN